MARPREFDPQAALQTAIQVFWEKGYYDTSVGEVVKRSGVAKYGIYGTFGNKEALFKQVLTQYARDRHQDTFIREINTMHKPKILVTSAAGRTGRTLPA